MLHEIRQWSKPIVSCMYSVCTVSVLHEWSLGCPRERKGSEGTPYALFLSLSLTVKVQVRLLTFA